MKRIITLILALSMVFTLAGCKKSVNVTMDGSKCGYFTLSGELGDKGTVTIVSGSGYKNGISWSANNNKYKYVKNGNKVTMTRQEWVASMPKTITGTYNSKTNTFSLDSESLNACISLG